MAEQCKYFSKLTMQLPELYESYTNYMSKFNLEALQEKALNNPLIEDKHNICKRTKIWNDNTTHTRQK